MTADLPRVSQTPIPGLLVVDLDLRDDERGWFKENWQRAKMSAAGLPDFAPVQHNVSFNGRRGVTRGIHAEPWDKFVSIANGRVFGAWVDLREGATFGTSYTHELGPETAVFVPRGVGNAYQVLEDATAYSYLVTAHWHPDADYTELSLADPVVAIPWPIPLDHPSVELSTKDQANPLLGSLTPIAPAPVLVIGCRGQLGQALQAVFPRSEGVDLDELDITDAGSVAAYDFSPYAVVLNAAAYTAVDAAETEPGRAAAWAANGAGPARLAAAANRHGFTLVHYSSDYVFDGTRTEHPEDEPVAPLSVYGQTKAAGDLAVGAVRRHYLLRTSWLIGGGPNFVRTMQRLALDGVGPSVVDDQIGRLTFATDLARATRHLVDTGSPFGCYHVSGAGEPQSWAQLASAVFAASGRDPGDVVPVSTQTYAAGKQLAPRPAYSTLSLDRIRSTGFEPRDAMADLADYLSAP